MPESIIVESRKYICYPIVNPGNVLQMEVKIILHAKHGQWVDQNYHRLALWWALGHDLNDGHIVTVYQDPLAFELTTRWLVPWWQHTALSSWCWWVHPWSQLLGICPDTSDPESSSQSQHCWHWWNVDILCWWASAIHIKGWPHSMWADTAATNQCPNGTPGSA